MVTLFLATVIGWYLVIFSVFLLSRHDVVRAGVEEIMAHRGLLLLSAIITVILGLMMVVSHNVWMMNASIIITLFSWLVLITGLLRLFFPEVTIRMAENFLKHPKRITVTGVIFLLIGLFLLYMVYFC